MIAAAVLFSVLVFVILAFLLIHRIRSGSARELPEYCEIRGCQEPLSWWYDSVRMLNTSTQAEFFIEYKVWKCDNDHEFLRTRA